MNLSLATPVRLDESVTQPFIQSFCLAETQLRQRIDAMSPDTPHIRPRCPSRLVEAKGDVAENDPLWKCSLSMPLKKYFRVKDTSFIYVAADARKKVRVNVHGAGIAVGEQVRKPAVSEGVSDCDVPRDDSAKVGCVVKQQVSS